MSLHRNLILLGAAGLLLMAAASEHTLRVAVFDSDRVRRESRVISSQMEQLAAPSRELLGQLQLKQAELTKELEAFNRQRSALSEELVRTRTEALQKKSEEIQRLSRQLKDRMDTAGSEGVAPLRQQVGQAVEAVARERNLDLVLSAQSVIYHTDAIDVTGAVIERLDSGAKKK
jgi:Skp family chaperone for outer membrane proteins